MIEIADAQVFTTDTQIVITGSPEESDTQHDCVAMGCGYEHVIFRFPLPVKEEVVS